MAFVVLADETGIRVKRRQHWLHCLMTKTLIWLGQSSKTWQRSI